MDIDPNKLKTTLSDHEKRLSRIEEKLHLAKDGQSRPLKEACTFIAKILAFVILLYTLPVVLFWLFRLIYGIYDYIR